MAASVPACALGLLILYSTADWILVERTGWLALDRDVTHFWLPAVFALALVFLFVSPHTALLEEGRRGTAKSLYWMIALAIVGAPTVIAQFYLHAATGTLVPIHSAAQAADHPGQAYFRANSICLDRAHIAVQPVIVAAGRNNEYLDVDVYIAVPLCEGGNVYIGLDYRDHIDNRLSSNEKEALYRAFLKECDKKLATENPARYTYLERVGPSTVLRSYEKAFKQENFGGSPIVLAPHSEDFDKRAGDLPGWLEGVLASGILLWLGMSLFAPFDPRKVARTRQGKSSALSIRDLVHIAIDGWGPALLFAANILVYVAMVLAGLGAISFQIDDLIAWGGNYAPALHGLGWLRLISSQFVHGGLMHILGNMYGLFFASIFLLPVSSNARFLFAYLVCGVGASIASVIYRPTTVSVGASGAIFGLFGVVLAYLLLGDKRLIEVRKMILLNVGIYLGYNLLIGMATPGIDNAAHVGGLATGLVLGIVFYLMDRARSRTETT